MRNAEWLRILTICFLRRHSNAEASNSALMLHCDTNSALSHIAHTICGRATSSSNNIHTLQVNHIELRTLEKILKIWSLFSRLAFPSFSAMRFLGVRDFVVESKLIDVNLKSLQAGQSFSSAEEENHFVEGPTLSATCQGHTRREH